MSANGWSRRYRTINLDDGYPNVVTKRQAWREKWAIRVGAAIFLAIAIIAAWRTA